MARCFVLSVASFSVACYGAHAGGGSLDSVRSLIEKRSGSNLALRSVLSRLSLTDMNSTMETLIDDINLNIVARIKLDHQETNQAIKSATKALSTMERRSTDQKQQADTSGTRWTKCVGRERECLVKLETTTSKLATLTQKVSEAQAAFDAVAQVKASPSLPEFKLDFIVGGHSSDAVASKLNMYKQEMTTMMSGVEFARANKHNEFLAAQKVLTTAVKNERRANRRANNIAKQCQNKRGKCSNLRGKRVVSMCAFGNTLNDKCEAVRDYNALVTKLDAVNGDEFSHVDRVQEWKVVQTALCLVRLLKKEATIDEASLSTCEEQAIDSFEKRIGTLNRKTEEVSDLIASSEFSCDAKTITFEGGNYNLAICDDEICAVQTSDSITFTGEYSPAISISDDDDMEPFSFCE